MLRRSRVLLCLLGCAAAAACAGGPPANTGAAPKRAPRVLGSGSPAAPAPPPEVRRSPGARQGSTVALAQVDGRVVAFVADEDDAAIRIFDVDAERETGVFEPGGVPAQLAVLADGRLVATLRDRAEVVVLRVAGDARAPLVVERRVAVAPEPIGLALSPDDATLAVTSGWGAKLTVLDARGFDRKAEHALAREPRAAVFSGDGRRVFVSHAVGEALDVVSLEGGTPQSLSLAGVEESFGDEDETFDRKRAACQGFTLARTEAGRVLAPHVLVFTGDPESTSSGYGGGGEGREAEVFHVPVVDEGAPRVLAGSTRLRAGVEVAPTRCALPRAAAVGTAGLFVTCLGADAVALYDADVVNPHDVELRRWSVPSGPTGIALDEEHHRAVVWSQFAHAITTIAIGDGEREVAPFALASTTLPRRTRTSARVERGRALFHATGEARISGDGRACASCHPDGRDDALVWSSPKGPRQTPMLAGRLDGAAPFGWNGDAADVSTHLVSTFKRLGGTGLTGEDKDALIAYVRAMRPPPAATPEDRAAVERGRALYASSETGCASCHGAGGDLPDGDKHDVKSRARGDVERRFDTPSLRFVSGSAPYFHDGRYPDLATLLAKSDGKMGRTKHLTSSQVADLEAYLRSL